MERKPLEIFSRSGININSVLGKKNYSIQVLRNGISKMLVVVLEGWKTKST